MAKGEQLRMRAVEKARAFKRSWVDMAETLVEIRNRRAYEAWGYETLHGYALEELHIKRATVDKLTGSYYTLEQHAPHVLEWDGVAKQVPEIEAIEYFAKAIDPPEKEARPSRKVVEELKQAIFEEQASAPSLRRRFNPILHPKEEGDDRRALLDRVRSSAERLSAMIPGVDGLSEQRVDQVTSALEELKRDLDLLAE
jgi:hypothetical protein